MNIYAKLSLLLPIIFASSLAQAHPDNVFCSISYEKLDAPNSLDSSERFAIAPDTTNWTSFKGFEATAKLKAICLGANEPCTEKDRDFNHYNLVGMIRKNGVTAKINRRLPQENGFIDSRLSQILGDEEATLDCFNL